METASGDTRVVSRNRPTSSLRTGNEPGLLIIKIEDAWEVAAIAEPWILALNATIEVTPAMIPADPRKAGPGHCTSRENIRLGANSPLRPSNSPILSSS
jgi:hypothetical protein